MSKDLHDQIMNIPCRRDDDTFLNTASRILYKEGHRDARHDAAELALAAPAVANAAKTNDLPPLPEPLDDRLLFKLVNALGAFGGGVSRDSIGPQQEAVGKLDAYLMGMMRDYARAAIAATAPNTALVGKK